jgi:hypothetical protein
MLQSTMILFDYKYDKTKYDKDNLHDGELTVTTENLVLKYELMSQTNFLARLARSAFDLMKGEPFVSVYAESKYGTLEFIIRTTEQYSSHESSLLIFSDCELSKPNTENIYRVDGYIQELYANDYILGVYSCLKKVIKDIKSDDTSSNGYYTHFAIPKEILGALEDYYDARTRYIVESI